MVNKKRKKKVERLNNFQPVKKETVFLKKIQAILFWIIKISLFPLFPIFYLFKLILKPFFIASSSDLFIRVGFGFLFVAILFQLAQLQVSGFSDFVNNHTILTNFTIDNSANTTAIRTISRSRRGQIFIRDDSQGNDSISVTSTEIHSSLFFDPGVLLSHVERGLVLDDAAKQISSVLNISNSRILDRLRSEIEKEHVGNYVVIQDSLTPEQISKLRFLRNPNHEPNRIFRFNSWLGITQQQRRTYPKGTMLADTIGYTPKHLISRSEAEERGFHQCMNMINANRKRGTDTKEYMLGAYGLEQRFCSELGGLNGFEFDEKVKRQDGGDLYLTIDINIQRKAEEVLRKAMIDNIGNDGKPPRDGAIVVLEAKTGKVRAMASYPTFDPNNYAEYWNPNSELYNPYAFRNAVTSIDYDPGSVMKTMTIAAALNVYEKNVIENGRRRGVSADFSFQDYDEKGKPYEERNGNVLRIRNAGGQSYKYHGKLGLKECLRDSINTCIADIVDLTGARQLNTYFREAFGFGRPTALRLPGDGNGDVRPFDRDIACPFCYANFGFGQGFTASPIQIARAYMPIANRGRMIEPYLVEKIKYPDGSIDDGTNLDSPIRREAPRQVLTERSANLTLSYMRAVIDEGHEGRGPISAQLPYHTAAGKTGTAEVSRPVPEGYTCPEGRSVQACNRMLGIYDHTFVGMAPYHDPQFIVLVKLSEPRRGEINNFSGNTVGRPFSEIMSYTLDYYGVPRDR